MKIGKYKIDFVESGRFKLDGGAMFGIIPKPLWENSNPADESNRILLTTRNLLLISDNRKILIDTGMGDKWDEKSKKIYDIDGDLSLLIKSLKNKNIKPEEITDVILTHLHFDHTGGSTKNENGRLVPVFPNAKYHVQKKNYEWAINPTDRDKGSYIKQNFVPLYEHGVFHFIDGEEQFDDEIQFLVINGHTFSQQLVKISDTENILLYSGDLLPFSSHFHLPFIMGYDLQPLVTLDEKRKILTKAAEENWKFFFEHDPYTVCATVKLTEKGFIAKERFESLDN